MDSWNKLMRYVSDKQFSDFFRNHKKILLELFHYGFWGGVTTFINFSSYWILLLIKIDYRIANLISMSLAKCFAYLVNKFFVFHSRCKTAQELMREILLFIITRSLSAVLEFVGLIFLVDICHTDRLFGKAFMLVLVIIANYIFGKGIVYKTKNDL